MEKGLDSYIRERFNIEDVDINTYSPLILAYIGDSIYDLVIRTILVGHGNGKVRDMHLRASHFVKAQTQSEMIERIKPLLTEDELAIYMRGRNAKSHTTAKNASVTEYRRATGFEALIGYLYLEDKFDRMLDLIEEGLKFEEV